MIASPPSFLIKIKGKKMRKIDSKTSAIVGLLIGSIFLKMYFLPGGILAYLTPIIFWSIVTIVTLHFSGGRSFLTTIKNPKIVYMAFLVAIFSIFLTLDAGLITKFARSPASQSAIILLLNLARIISRLLGIELSRARILDGIKKINSFASLVIVTVFFTLIETSITGLLNFRDALVYVQYLGETFLPALAESLLASYVALLAGPIAALVYRTPFQLFMWIFPILPDLPWGFKSLIGVMVPTIGFAVISTSSTNRDFLVAGLKVHRGRFARKEESGSSKWILGMSFISVLGVYLFTGLLGVYPTIVASGSMKPALQVGDIVVSVKPDPYKVETGDIIQFRKGNDMILHRVIEVDTSEGRRFITQGDANRVADLDPVSTEQIVGKRIFTIPKIGWIPIYSKRVIDSLRAILVNNQQIVYPVLIIGASSYTIFSFWRNKNRIQRLWTKNVRW